MGLIFPSDLLVPHVSFLLSLPACLKLCTRADDDPSLAENSDSPRFCGVVTLRHSCSGPLRSNNSYPLIRTRDAGAELNQPFLLLNWHSGESQNPSLKY